MSHYTFTYDIVTPESAEQGDSADNGFWMPGGWLYSCNRDSVLEEARIGSFDHKCSPGWLREIRNELGCLDAVQTNGKFVSAYECEGNTDWGSGAVMRRAVHVKCPSEASAERVAHVLSHQKLEPNYSLMTADKDERDGR